MILEKGLQIRLQTDACVGYIELHNLFPDDQIQCTKSLYSAVWRNDIGIIPMMLTEAISRNTRQRKYRKKRVLGTSIEFRPAIAAEKTEFSHWEIGTVVPLKDKKETVILTILEKSTRYCMSFKLRCKNAEAVYEAIGNLRVEYGSRFGKVFKTITSGNYNEFSILNEYVIDETKVNFAHPYSSSERAQNERHSRMLREYIPKGCSIEKCSNEEILSFSDVS